MDFFPKQANEDEGECNQLASNTGMAVYLGPASDHSAEEPDGPEWVAALQLAAV